MTTETCPACRAGISTPYREVEGVLYLRCGACGTIHVGTALLEALDAGQVSRVVDYDAAYWAMELHAARQRARGESLARAGEAVLYCRRPVRRFLDLGAGAGLLLEQLHQWLDPEGAIFHGVELFPPEAHYAHANYHFGTAMDLEGHFDAGCCIEVIEHLTPRMLDALAGALARVSQPDTFWLFNTGLAGYVEHEDPDYLDPHRRGHIVSWSIEGLRAIFGPHGFRISALPGKSFAVAAEFQATQDTPYEERIYSPLPENLALLQRAPLVYQAAFEAARSYLYFAAYLQRTAWAQSLDAQLRGARGPKGGGTT